MRLEQVEVSCDEETGSITIQQDDHGMGEQNIYLPAIEAIMVAKEILRLAEKIIENEAQ